MQWGAGALQQALVPRYDTAAIYWDTEKDQAFHDFAFKAHSEGSIPIFWACSETMDLC